MVDILGFFSFQLMVRDWCNKGSGMCCYVHRLVHIKDPLLLIGNSSPCSGGNRFLLVLYKWSFTICPMPYNRFF